ncbi:MAG: LysR family transcriptional regulator [Boseongicola sp.]|nr:MAG: LysR family transcriptional regulator [Boseongicola sp.]
MPTLQQLRYLLALSNERHFRRAAEVCHVTQPTLSGQLRELELRLGAPLIERNRNPVILTSEGQEIATRARRVLAEVEDIRAIARRASDPFSGTIRLGIVHSLGSYLMPLIVPDLHKQQPDLRLYIREGLPNRLFDQLENGDLDLLLFPLPATRRGLATKPLFIEPLQVVVPHSHPMARLTSVNRRDLKGETLLTLEPGHRLYEQVRTLADSAKANLSHDYEGTSLDTIRQMVAMELGISLMPSLYVRSEVARETLVTARPFKGPDAPSRMIGAVWRKGSVREESLVHLTDMIKSILARDIPEIDVIVE